MNLSGFATLREMSKRYTMKIPLKLTLSALLVALILSIIILSCVPPVSRDALTHHLAVPKLYLNHGGIYEIPSLEFSYYPMNLDLLYMIPLYSGNDIIPKFIHFAFALLTAWLIFGYLKKRTDTVYALLGVLFFLSLPVIVKLSITVYVDLGLIFFSTASLLLILKWMESDFKLTYLILSGAFCGLALGTKYNGLIVFFLLALFVPFIYSRARRKAHLNSRRAIGYGAIFVLIALLVFTPWMIRNYMWTNNPIYPLYDGWFNPAETGSSAAMSAFQIRKSVYGESWWETALIPMRIFFQGQDDSPRYFDGKLNPYLFLLPFFAFLVRRKNNAVLRTEKNIFLAFLILYLFYAFFKTDMRIRYIAPIIPPLVILSVIGLHGINTMVKEWLPGAIGKVTTVVVFAFILFSMGMNASYVLEQFRQVDPIRYISGEVSRDEYIEKYRPEYPAIQYANRNLPRNAKILCIFLGNRRYYSDREMIFGINLFRDTVREHNRSEKVLIALSKNGITHILVSYYGFNGWFKDSFNDREKETIREFFEKHVNLLFSEKGHGLFQLKSHS